MGRPRRGRVHSRGATPLLRTRVPANAATYGTMTVQPPQGWTRNTKPETRNPETPPGCGRQPNTRARLPATRPDADARQAPGCECQPGSRVRTPGLWPQPTWGVVTTNAIRRGPRCTRMLASRAPTRAPKGRPRRGGVHSRGATPLLRTRVPACAATYGSKTVQPPQGWTRDAKPRGPKPKAPAPKGWGRGANPRLDEAGPRT